MVKLLAAASVRLRAALRPFMADLCHLAADVVVGSPGWEQQLEAGKQAFTLERVQHPEFIAQLPDGMAASA